MIGSRSVLPDIPSKAFEMVPMIMVGLILVAILGLTVMIVALGRESSYFVMFIGFLPYLLGSAGTWWWLRKRRLKKIAQRQKLLEALQNG